MEGNMTLIILLYIIGNVLIVMMAHRMMFRQLLPLDLPEVKLAIKMVDTDPGEYPLDDEQFKFVRGRLRIANLPWAALWIISEGVVVRSLYVFWEELEFMTVAVAISINVAIIIYYLIVRHKLKKRVFVKNRSNFRRRQGCLVNQDTKSIDVHYTVGGESGINTYYTHKVIVGVYDWEGKPKAYRMRMSNPTYEATMKNGKCDIITFNDTFVVICNFEKEL